jgi:anti-sigma factor RsiW
MGCWTIRKRLSAFADGELGPRDAARVRDHVARCTACTERLESLRALGVEIDAAEPPAPGADLWPGVLRKLADPPARSREPARWLVPAAVGASALLGVAIGAVTAVGLRSDERPAASAAPGGDAFAEAFGEIPGEEETR